MADADADEQRWDSKLATLKAQAIDKKSGGDAKPADNKINPSPDAFKPDDKN